MDVDKMQTKLATWAQDPSFRFDDIYNLVYDEDWLYRAYGSVKSNSGSRTAGIDGQVMEDFTEDLEENMKDLMQGLKSQSFDPRPVRRTYIPKGDGRERPLGIPTIKDRIVQEALRMVLEPIYETDFSQYSFGFRPGRSTHDAICYLSQRMVPDMNSYMPWIIDADVKGFFDNVDHQVLEQTIQDRITDQKLRDLIWDFLKAGVMEDGSFRHSTLGTPQGGIVSPVLANIYLNELDQWAEKWTDLPVSEKNRRYRKGKGNWAYLRYADDFLFLTNGNRENAEEMKERVGSFVSEELNLTLSEEKTQLVHAEDGINFLGYDLESSDRPDGGVDRSVPKEAKQDIRAKIRAATNRSTDVSARTKIKALNTVLRGWAQYYKYANDSARVFGEIEHVRWKELTGWLARKYSRSRSRLFAEKLDGKNPISINGVEVVVIRRISDTHDSPLKDEHPYLEGSRERQTIPDDDPWLAVTEDRPGWKDARRKALERDDWNCQECGRELEAENAEVHHLKPYTEYDNPKEANRLENLNSLCKECHQKVESEDLR